MKIFTAPIIDLGTYEFKYLNTVKITPEEYFVNAYVDKVYEQYQVRTSTKQLPTILDAKYENSYLNKLMKNQFQNLTE